jgi:sulfite oxidase
MNGKPLPAAYGYPVRVVVPGVAGARWVKWLDRITVQKVESPNFYQQHDYKILPPEALTWDMAEPYWAKAPAIQCMPVNSVVAMPDDGETAQTDEHGFLEVRGYAVPQGAQGPVVRVEVSGDNCQTWTDAELLHFPGETKWCWVLWRARIKVEKGCGRTIFSKATDAGGNTQPRECQWNIRGVAYNGYGASWNVTVR